MISAARLLLMAAAVAMAAGCAAPLADDGAFRVDALRTVQDARSQVVTTSLVLQSSTDDKVLATSANVIATTAVSQLDTVAGTFNSIEPPPAQDDLAKQVDDALQAAQSASRQALLAIRRGDLTQIPAIQEKVDRSAHKLEELEDQLSPEQAAS